MSDVEVTSDGGRRRRWSTAEKLRIVEETLDEMASISVVARRIGVAPNLLYRWRRLMLERGSVAVTGDDEVTSNKLVRHPLPVSDALGVEPGLDGEARLRPVQASAGGFGGGVHGMEPPVSATGPLPCSSLRGLWLSAMDRLLGYEPEVGPEPFCELCGSTAEGP